MRKYLQFFKNKGNFHFKPDLPGCSSSTKLLKPECTFCNRKGVKRIECAKMSLCNLEEGSEIKKKIINPEEVRIEIDTYASILSGTIVSNK